MSLRDNWLFMDSGGWQMIGGVRGSFKKMSQSCSELCTASEKWCLTISVAMDTFSAGTAPPRLAPRQLIAARDFSAHPWLRVEGAGWGVRGGGDEVLAGTAAPVGSKGGGDSIKEHLAERGQRSACCSQGLQRLVTEMAPRWSTDTLLIWNQQTGSLQTISLFL